MSDTTKDGSSIHSSISRRAVLRGVAATGALVVAGKVVGSDPATAKPPAPLKPTDFAQYLEGKYVDPSMRGDRSIEEAVLDEKRREDWIRGRTNRRMLRWGDAHIGTLPLFASRLAAFNVPVTSDFRLDRRPRIR